MHFCGQGVSCSSSFNLSRIYSPQLRFDSDKTVLDQPWVKLLSYVVISALVPHSGASEILLCSTSSLSWVRKSTMSQKQLPLCQKWQFQLHKHWLHRRKIRLIIHAFLFVAVVSFICLIHSWYKCVLQKLK